MHHEFLLKGRTVNKEYYLQVMRNLRETIRQKRRIYGRTKIDFCPMGTSASHRCLCSNILPKTKHTLRYDWGDKNCIEGEAEQDHKKLLF